jgi:hypothetical protein
MCPGILRTFKTRGGLTMRAAYKTLLCTGLFFSLALFVRAADEKKTLKGEIGCPKCLKDFKALVDAKYVPKKCANAIKVKDGDKEVVYLILDDKGNKEPYHGCTAAKKGSVTGVVSKKGNQLFIKPDKDGVKIDE